MDKHWTKLTDAELVKEISDDQPGAARGQAVLTLRNTEAVKDLTAATTRSADKMQTLTTWLVVLTLALIGLGVATLIVAANG